jgi:hypothetical protein
LFVSSDQIAASEQAMGAFGVAVVSDQASAIGVTAVPTPITDADSDLWFTFQYGIARLIFDAGGAIHTAPTVYQFDSRAMRKVEQGQDIVSTFENASGTDGLLYLALWRMLVKLH